MITEDPKDPSESITFTIKDISYTIKFPNTGQLIDIENRKVLLRPRAIDFSTESSTLANILVEAIATFEILSPQVIKDLNVNIFDLDLLKSRYLTKVYLRQYMPWYNQWLKIISNLDAIE